MTVKSKAKNFLPVIFGFAIGLSGVATFQIFLLPLPWLLGPIFACLVAALLRVPMRGVAPLNAAMRTILGVAVGATLTPQVVASLPGLWSTLILVPLMVFLIGLFGVPYFQRIWKYDFATAYYGSMPGGLQDMLVFGEEAGGNVRSLSLIHATRVLVIVVALPFVLQYAWEADLSNLPGDPVVEMAADQLFLMLFASGFGWWFAAKIGMFGATILGPLFVAAVLALSGFLTTRPPAEAIWAAQFFIGITIGSKYVGITIQELKRDIVAGLGFSLILIILTILFVSIIYSLGLANGMDALLAFAPGGQAELTVLALIVGADAAFVVSHHVLRIFLVILGSPIASRIFNRDVN